MYLNTPNKTPLGALLRSKQGSIVSEYEMTFVLTSFPAVYGDPAGEALWDEDWARWEAIEDSSAENLNYYSSFWSKKIMKHFIVIGGLQTTPGAAGTTFHNSPFNGIPIPNNADVATSRIRRWEMYIKGYGGQPDPTLDTFLSPYVYGYGQYGQDPRPRHVKFNIHEDANVSRDDYNPGLDDFQDWLDAHETSWDETTTPDTDGRWLKWMCDFYDERYS